MSFIQIIRKFSTILSRHQKLRVAELAVLMVIGGLLETTSVSLVFPFMEAAMNPEGIMEKSYARWICRLLDIHSSGGFLVVASVAIAAIYILKNAYLLFEYDIQYRFVYGNMFEMQKRLLDSFMHRPYEYFLGVNSAEIIRIVNVDTSTVFGILATILAMLTEIVVCAMMIATVFIMSPGITVVIAAILLTLMLVINQILKPMLKKAGIENHNMGIGMNKWLLQSIHGIKEMKVMRQERFFQENFDRYGKRYVWSLRRNQILSITPRFLIEAIGMSAIFLILGVLIYNGSLAEALPVISVVGMAAVRLLPSVNRMSSSLATIAFGEPLLDKLIANLKDISGKEDVTLMMDLRDGDDRQKKEKSLAYEKTLDFHEITYHYPSSEKRVLENASMTITAGESVGIVGESGAGKSTAVDIILGLLNPERGQVLIDGDDIVENIDGWLSQVGYIPQMIFMLDDSIRENVAFGVPASEFTDDDIWYALEEASLAEFVRQLPEGLNTEIGERGVRLSGGQRQRIGIARALFRNPKVLIFDEATSALDNTTESAIMESIHGLRGKKTLIIIAHRLTTIEGCDHVYRVEDGKIRKER